MPAYMGGLAITSAAWLTATGLAVSFSSTYRGSKYYQLYAGRTRIATTSHPLERTIVGDLLPSHWPQEICLLAVDPADRLTDFGALLPPRPYNRVKLDFSVAGYTDGKYIEITAGDTPGGSVDASNVLIKLLYGADGAYEYITPPLAGSGTWNFKAQGLDQTLPNGNAGAALALQAVVLAHPPDVFLSSPRLAGNIAAGVATVSFAYDW